MADNGTIGSKNGQSPERAMTHINTCSQLNEKTDSSAASPFGTVAVKAEPSSPDDREYYGAEVSNNCGIKVDKDCAAVPAGTPWEAKEVGDCTNIKQELEHEIISVPTPISEITLAPMRNCKMYICDICDKVYHRKARYKRATNETSQTEPTNGTTIKVEPLDRIKTEPSNDCEARMIDGTEHVAKCNENFKSKMEHSTHYNELLYVCNVCSKRCLDKGGFPKHYEVLHRLERVTCRTCRLTFTIRSEFKVLLETHSYVPCFLCSKLYLDKNAMYRHMLYTHEKTECKFCGERSESVRALSSHLCKKGAIEMKFGATPRQYGRSKALKK